jgi:hypothetical protein
MSILLKVFTGRVDLIVVRYSVSIGDLPSNDLCNLQDNVVKVNRL